jgi:hypothetical protein
MSPAELMTIGSPRVKVRPDIDVATGTRMPVMSAAW